MAEKNMIGKKEKDVPQTRGRLWGFLFDPWPSRPSQEIHFQPRKGDVVVVNADTPYAYQKLLGHTPSQA